MKKSKFTEEQIAYALRQVESGTPAGGCLPAAGRQRSHVLHLEEEVRAPRRQRAAPAAIARGRECPAEAAGRRPVARQAHPDRGPAKKSLRPTQRRELAGWVQSDLRASAACGPVIWRSSVGRRGIAAVRRDDQTAAAVAHSRARPRAAALRVLAHLGAAASRGLAGEQEARASPVSPRGPAAADARAATQAHRACIAGRRRPRRARPSAGAWTSCMMRWPMGDRFACSRWSISGVARARS